MELNLNDKNATLRSIIHVASKRKITDRELALYPMFIVLKILLMEVMESLKETNLYQKEIKMHGNKFYDALTNGIIDDRYFQIYEADKEALQSFEKGVNLLASVLCNANSDIWGIIAVTADLAIKDKDFVLDRLNIVYDGSDRISEMREKEDLINGLRDMPINGVRYLKTHLDAAKRLYPSVKPQPE